MLTRIRQFRENLEDKVLHDLWQDPERDIGRRRRFRLRVLRVVVAAGQGFRADALPMRASALTYYTLLSIVPALALAFGVAKGLGLEAALEQTLRLRLAGQEAVLDRAIVFARTLLASTRGGLVAGAGAAVLLWSVIRLLANIERAFNQIWSVDQARTTWRKLTDYVAITLIAPLLLLAASSAAVMLDDSFNAAVDNLHWLRSAGSFLSGVFRLGPLVLSGLVLTLLYLTLPNTRVSPRAGLVAGIVAGSLYQLLQFAYIDLQLGVSRYNAIYGSFAALPLFLVWLHLSWMIVLVGAEVAWAVDHRTGPADG